MVQTTAGNLIELIMNREHNSVLVIGCMHGDEPQGEYLIKKYLVNLHIKIKSTDNSVLFL